MRTEAKLTIVLIVLIGVIVGLYFYKSADKEPIRLSSELLVEKQEKATEPFSQGRPTEESRPPLSDTLSRSDAERLSASGDSKTGESSVQGQGTEEIEPVAITIDVEQIKEKLLKKDTLIKSTAEGGISVDLSGSAASESAASEGQGKEGKDAQEFSEPTGTVEGKVIPNEPVRIGDLPTMAMGSPASEGQEKVHIVKPGESLYKIAELYYGDGRYWNGILKANPDIKDPDRLRVGQRLIIPPREELEYANLPRKIPSDISREDLVPYKVKVGESFYTIARDLLGSAARWRELYRINKSVVGDNPRNLRAGQVILVPRR